MLQWSKLALRFLGACILFLGALALRGRTTSLVSIFRRARSSQDVAAHGLWAHGGLVLAQVQVSVAEEVRKVRDAADVLQSLHNHHVLR